MSKTAIRSCTCTNEYQDRRYGRGRRVHNELKRQQNRPSRWRCTVCKEVKSD